MMKLNTLIDQVIAESEARNTRLIELKKAFGDREIGDFDTVAERAMAELDETSANDIVNHVSSIAEVVLADALSGI